MSKGHQTDAYWRVKKDTLETRQCSIKQSVLHCSMGSLVFMSTHIKKLINEFKLLSLPANSVQLEYIMNLTSIGLNSTLHPMSEFTGGGLNLIVCQFVDWIF